MSPLVQRQNFFQLRKHYVLFWCAFQEWISTALQSWAHEAHDQLEQVLHDGQSHGGHEVLVSDRCGVCITSESEQEALGDADRFGCCLTCPPCGEQDILLQEQYVHIRRIHVQARYFLLWCKRVLKLLHFGLLLLPIQFCCLLKFFAMCCIEEELKVNILMRISVASGSCSRTKHSSCIRAVHRQVSQACSKLINGCSAGASLLIVIPVGLNTNSPVWKLRQDFNDECNERLETRRLPFSHVCGGSHPVSVLGLPSPQLHVE